MKDSGELRQLPVVLGDAHAHVCQGTGEFKEVATVPFAEGAQAAEWCDALEDGADSDTASIGVENIDWQGNTLIPWAKQTVGLMVVHSSTASFTASLVCKDGVVQGGIPLSSSAFNSKLVAVKVGSLSNAAE